MNATAIRKNQWEQPYMPIRLKAVLTRNGLSQKQWSEAVKQTHGRSLTQTASNLLVNWNTWPKDTPAESIQQQTAEFLRAHKVPEEEIATVWEFDETDEARWAKPQKTAAAARTAEREEIQLPETVMLSPAAKKHFRLFKDPFTDDIQSVDDLYLDADQRYILEAMYHAAKHGGFVAIVGESGSGKSTVRRAMYDRFAREGTPITVIQPRIIDKGRLDTGAICDAIIRDISSERPKQSLENKARQIEKLLVGSSRAGNSHVLIIEEAHDLTIKTLKYLKRFWELEDGFRKLLSIVLIGQPELKQLLDERTNWEAREVIQRCEIAELPPLGRNIGPYLAMKFQRVGGALEDIVAPDVVDALQARLTIRQRGDTGVINMTYPLRVNNAITKAMNIAADIGVPKVTAEIVRGL